MEIPPRRPRPGQRLTGIAALVVDDMPDVAATLAAILAHEGARVTTAGSAAEALHVVREDVPDIVLADLRMKPDSGFALLERIRAHEDPRVASVPVVAVTGELDYQAELYEVPFTARILKPVDAQVLISVVEQIIRQKPA